MLVLSHRIISAMLVLSLAFMDHPTGKMSHTFKVVVILKVKVVWHQLIPIIDNYAHRAIYLFAKNIAHYLQFNVH